VPHGGLVLTRCDANGSACTHASLPARGVCDLVIDPIADKLLVPVGTRPDLLRCATDGTACTTADISAGATVSAGVKSVVLDAASQKLLVVAQDDLHQQRLALFRCNVDGTGCTYSDISAGRGPGSGRNPSAAISGGKLLVVTEGASSGSGPTLYSCALDGAGCSWADISASRPYGSGLRPRLLVYGNNLLVVSTDGSNDSKAALVRCGLDGSSCTYADLSAGAGAGTGGSPSAAIDDVAQRLLVVTTDADASARLVRCELAVDLGPPMSGMMPSAVIDKKAMRLLVATDDLSNLERPALATLDLW
jgi:hypothetical protein